MPSDLATVALHNYDSKIMNLVSKLGQCMPVIRGDDVTYRYLYVFILKENLFLDHAILSQRGDINPFLNMK